LIEQVQKVVVQELIGHGHLLELSESKDSIFFEEIESQLLDRMPDLKEGFKGIGSYKVSYSNLILHWLRPALDELVPDVNLDPISQTQSHLYSKETIMIIEALKSPIKELFMSTIGLNVTLFPRVVTLMSKALEFVNQSSMNRNSLSTVNLPIEELDRLTWEALKSRRNEIVDECEKILEDRLNEPNQIAYSMVQEFVDRVLISEDVKTQWLQFFWTQRSKIWPGFKGREERMKRQKRWKELVNFAVDANKLDALRLL